MIDQKIKALQVRFPGFRYIFAVLFFGYTLFFIYVNLVVP